MFLLQAARSTARKSLSFKKLDLYKNCPGVKRSPECCSFSLPATHRIIESATNKSQELMAKS